MKTIWKYPIPFQDQAGNVTDRPEIMMPNGAKLLTVQMQGGKATIWAVVDPDRFEVPVCLAIVGTGNDVRRDVATDRYVGMFQAGSLVFHVFEAYS